MKQAILVRQDLKLSRGKASAQTSHASVEAVLKSNRKMVEGWRQEGMKKVILKVKDEEEILEYKRQAEKAGLITSLIRDAGKTHLEPNTITCLAIGPDEDKKIDRITGHLKLIN